MHNVRPSVCLYVCLSLKKNENCLVKNILKLVFGRPKALVVKRLYRSCVTRLAISSCKFSFLLCFLQLFCTEENWKCMGVSLYAGLYIPAALTGNLGFPHGAKKRHKTKVKNQMFFLRSCSVKQFPVFYKTMQKPAKKG